MRLIKIFILFFLILTKPIFSNELKRYSKFDIILVNPEAKRLHKVASSKENGGKYEEAENIYKEIIKIEPSAETYCSLACCQYIQRKYEEATDNFKKALEFDQNNIRIHVGLGSIAYDNKEFKKALKHYNEAYKINDKISAIHWGLAITYSALDNPSKAKSFYEIFVIHSNEESNRKYARNEIKKIESLIK